MFSPQSWPHTKKYDIKLQTKKEKIVLKKESKVAKVTVNTTQKVKPKRPASRHGKTGQKILTQLEKPNPNSIFFTRSKNKLTRDLTRDPNRTQTLFLKLFFFVKLRQYWFNCLLWGLKKPLIHLHNCMQINWKINGWSFCNE